MHLRVGASYRTVCWAARTAVCDNVWCDQAALHWGRHGIPACNGEWRQLQRAAGPPWMGTTPPSHRADNATGCKAERGAAPSRARRRRGAVTNRPRPSIVSADQTRPQSRPRTRATAHNPDHGQLGVPHTLAGVAPSQQRLLRASRPCAQGPSGRHTAASASNICAQLPRRRAWIPSDHNPEERPERQRNTVCHGVPAARQCPVLSSARARQRRRPGWTQLRARCARRGAATHLPGAAGAPTAQQPWSSSCCRRGTTSSARWSGRHGCRARRGSASTSRALLSPSSPASWRASRSASSVAQQVRPHPAPQGAPRLFAHACGPSGAPRAQAATERPHCGAQRPTPPLPTRNDPPAPPPHPHPPRRLPPAARNTYAFAVGLLLLYYPFGSGIAHIVFTSWMTYFVMWLIPRKCGTLAWLINFPYLLVM